MFDQTRTVPHGPRMISYGRSDEVWDSYSDLLLQLIDDWDLRRVCDVGGGANPVFPAELLSRKHIDYTVVDISEVELCKADGRHRRIVADIGATDFSISETFDLVFSKMVAEHVVDAEQMHKNIFDALNAGGLAVHFFPTLYAPPFVLNRLMPERLSDRLLRLVNPTRDRRRQGKFPAYYNWCRGPTARQIGRFEGIGYEIVEYRGLFGHSGYYNRIRPLAALHSFIAEFLLRHPIPLLTSFSLLVLRKPLPETPAQA